MPRRDDEELDDDEPLDDEYVEWEDEEEDEEWEDDEESFAPSGWDEDGDGVVSALEVTRTVSFGFLSMVPLLVAYEWAFHAVSQHVDGGPRSVAEALVSSPLAPFGSDVMHLARRIGLGVLALVTLIVSLRREWGLGPRLIRVPLEGALAAVALGPILAIASSLAEPYVGAMVVGSSAGVPELSRAGLVIGGAAYEELVFRVLVLALAFVFARKFLGHFGLDGRFGGLLAALFAAVTSAALFALFHLGTFNAWLGPGGEEFDAAIFTWRAIAGILLAGLVVWRGVGVAAWAHALFNVALLVGVRPPPIT